MPESAIFCCASQSQFECLECGYTANADINGARNILAAGHACLMFDV
ncbi:zinc ribbon domain-containing protein [Proteus mirabilis]|nr:zinc ribbon domain-containing protein [Proteus mirabilis]UXJ01443.1 zinc ribbon domain-containing protein [Proteus mirabilis]